jgi:hypothetical protein
MRRLLPVLVLSSLLASPALAAADDAPRSRAVREADGAVRFADRAGRRLLSLLDRARREGDARRVSCVDAKLTQVNSFARLVADRRRRLVAAEARDDAGAAAHERRVIRTLRAQIRTLEEEGRACVFPGADQASGQTVVTVIVDPRVVPADDRLLGDADRRRRW